MSAEIGQGDTNSHADKSDHEAASKSELSGKKRKNNTNPSAERLKKMFKRLARKSWRNTKVFGRWFKRNSQPVLVIATILILLIYRSQLDQMRKSTDAAKQASRLAKRNIQKVENNARLDQRAWVGVSAIKGNPEVGKAFKVTITIMNTGRTFAKNVDMVARGQPVTVWESPEFAGVIGMAAHSRNPEAIGHVLLAPNATTDQALKGGEDSLVSDTELQDFQNGNVRFIIYGQITYVDIFERSHWLTFCAHLTYQRDEPVDRQWSWMYCKENNNTGDGAAPIHTE